MHQKLSLVLENEHIELILNTHGNKPVAQRMQLLLNANNSNMCATVFSKSDYVYAVRPLLYAYI